MPQASATQIQMPATNREALSTRPTSGTLIAALVLLLLIALPWILIAFGQDYYLEFARRILIVAMIATSLNLLIGYGGMVALGHAGFVGVGAYTMVAAAEAGVSSAWILWFYGAVGAGVAALLIGSIAIRTRSVYFIMITLAFSQMLYYFAVSLRTYGGDDGYNLSILPQLGAGLKIDDNSTFYWVVLAIAVCLYFGLKHLLASPYGKALCGTRDNEIRMSALGFPVYRIQLIAFVIAGAVAGLGGALLLTHNTFVSPSSMSFTQSTALIVMVALGGMLRPWGPALGTVIWMTLEEFLRQYTEYWHWPLGIMLILIILIFPFGLSSIQQRRRDSSEAGPSSSKH